MEKVIKRLSSIIPFSKSSQVVTLLASQILAGIFVTITTLWVFFALGEDVLEKEVFSFDSSIIRFVYLFRSGVMTEIMKIITFFGGTIFLGIAIVTTVLFLLRRHKKDALIFSYIFFLGVGINIILKDLFHRSRPTFMPLVHESSYSFPSGHSMNSFIFYSCVSFFIFRKMKNKLLGRVLMVFSAILISLIGLSRIYLGAHYPSDVFAGYAAGLCLFVIVLLFERAVYFLHLFRKYETERKY